MAHIEVDKSLTGIRSLVMYRPESGEHLYALARALLRGESPIAAADRELIASYVSSLRQSVYMKMRLQPMGLSPMMTLLLIPN